MTTIKLKEEMLFQLAITEESSEWHELLQKADEWARNAFDNKGTLFAQIGLDAQPCPANCGFCALAEDSTCFAESHILDTQNLTNRVQEFLKEGINELFLMTTASFKPELFLEYGKLVRSLLPEGMSLIANTGDFDCMYAQNLKKAGFTGVYHICRLGEGIDTAITVEKRIQTLNAARNSGLDIYYCVEPIGPEHTNEEIATEILRAIEYKTPVMAVMKRIAVPGTKLHEKGEISAHRLATICAVATLSVKPTRAMGVHEPDKLCLTAGANQIYAECGKNPRDTKSDTRDGRGFSTEQAKTMLSETNWTIY